MIYTKMKNIEAYRGIHINLDTAIDFILNHDLKTLTMGRNDVDGEKVFINRFNYQTIPTELGFFEAHEKHLDIHLLLSGRERIGISDIANMTIKNRDVGNDGVDCEGPLEQTINMEPGDVLIAFPHDAHMVKLESSGSCTVEKAVVKVLLQ
jgi:biofilm protein TabA